MCHPSIRRISSGLGGGLFAATSRINHCLTTSFEGFWTGDIAAPGGFAACVADVLNNIREKLALQEKLAKLWYSWLVAGIWGDKRESGVVRGNRRRPDRGRAKEASRAKRGWMIDRAGEGGNTRKSVNKRGIRRRKHGMAGPPRRPFL